MSAGAATPRLHAPPRHLRIALATIWSCDGQVTAACIRGPTAFYLAARFGSSAGCEHEVKKAGTASVRLTQLSHNQESAFRGWPPIKRRGANLSQLLAQAAWLRQQPEAVFVTVGDSCQRCQRQRLVFPQQLPCSRLAATAAP